MRAPELLDNVNRTLKDDLELTLAKGDKLSIAAACFSIYAFQALKKQLTTIDELRFIFTSPTFVQEKAPKEKREFYIPRLNRERLLYGTEFEVKLKNELTQKAIAEAGRPIRRTLRPVPEESKSWDTTENLCIEGDYLDVKNSFKKATLKRSRVIILK